MSEQSRLQAHGIALRQELNDRFDSMCAETFQVNMQDLSKPLSPACQEAIFREYYASEHDPYGDGDQSPVPDPSIKGEAAAELADPLRSAWSTGLDTNFVVREPGNEFHLAAATGDIVTVETSIEEAKKQVEEGDEEALMRLLEKRISLCRMTPLMYCAHGARVHAKNELLEEEGKLKFNEVAEALLAAGARVDALDICGYTALALAAGFVTSEESIALVKILTKYGANPNIRNRFGESYLVHPIWANNIDAFKTLLLAGADVLLADNSGLTPRRMANHSPRMVQVMTEVQRVLLLRDMECNACGKKGADKFCAQCRTAYYCSKKCQTQDWKSGHKAVCGKAENPGSYLDLVIDTMTSRDPLPGVRTPPPQFTNSITGATSRRRMRPKEYNKSFIIKINSPIILEGVIGAVKINVKNSDFLLVKNRGEGKAAHSKLCEVIKDIGIDVGKIYLSAKWLPPKQVQGKKKASNVLRIDISKGLPPPKPLW